MNREKIISIFILLIFVTNFFIPITLAAEEKVEKLTDEKIQTEETMVEETQKQEEKTAEKNEELNEEKTQKQEETTTEKNEELNEEKIKEEETTTEKNEELNEEKIKEEETTTEKNEELNEEKINEEQTETKTISEVDNKIIKEGTYKIKANVGTNVYLDIDGGREENGANLQIWEKADEDQQKFKITDLKNGYYTITCERSKKVLDVADAGTALGTNVQQWESNGTNAQQWSFEPVGNGLYYIKSKCNDLYLDIDGAYSNNGTNVQMWEGNKTNAQQFDLQALDAPIVPNQSEEDKPKLTPANITDGVYKIKSKINENKVIDIDGEANDGNAQIWADVDTKNQKFHIKKIAENTYTIRAVHTKFALDVQGASKEIGTNVLQHEYNGTNAQQWQIQVDEKGYYTIVSKCNGLVLDIKDANVFDGANIQVWESNGTDAQKFELEKTQYQIIDDGMYEIQSVKDKSRVIDISNADQNRGARVQTWARANVNQQKFNVKYNKADDTYTLEAVHSGKVIDIPDAKAISGQELQQWEPNGTPAQKWKMIDFGDGTYNVESALNSALCLDIKDGIVGDGSPIQVFNKNGTAAQLFNFIKTTPAPVGSGGMGEINAIDEARYPGFKSALQTLKNQHPNWEIKVLYTGLDWNTVLNNEDALSGGSPKSLIPVNDKYKGEWKVGDETYDRGSCYRASRKAIAYMMDPRTSLDADGSWLFQFQDLSSSTGTKEEIKRMVSGSFLDNDSLIEAIISAARDNGVSPFHIASRIIQEQGRDGHGTMNGHYTYNGRTVYNLYNIDVTSADNAMERGAKYAYDRNWFTPEASIRGGAEFLKRNYIGKGQSTLYFQKYNVVSEPLYDHQYMQNIRGANDEGNSIYYSYKNNGILDSHFTFTIPLYENMPGSACPRPVC